MSSTLTRSDTDQFDASAELFTSEQREISAKLDDFAKYASRQSIARFCAKYEIFKQILDVNGSIIECGVLHGAGLLTWAKLSSIFEPANHLRKVIGFDTFEGFPAISEEDTRAGSSPQLKVGGLKGADVDGVRRAVDAYDLNRPIGHIQKVELIKGDIGQTASQYVEQNPHLVVALLHLDLDIYEPTKRALEVFVPRMPRGGIIFFDELNAKKFPGETTAVAEVLGLRNLSIRRFHFDTYASYAVL